jgi:prenyltransferase beta subunit
MNMRQIRRRLLACLLVSLTLAAAASAATLSREQREASIAYVLSLQNPDGGFRATAAPGKSQLAATTACLRSLKYFGGKLPDRDATLKFVRNCHDPAAGSFADMPGGTPDVRSTAMGLMALAELRAPLPDGGQRIVTYFDQNAKALPEIYIAVAALDSARLKAPTAERWVAAYEATRTASGTYGAGGMESARVVNTLVRLGSPVKEREAVVRDVKALQRPDGGFAAAEGPADLGASYTVMRALVLLKEKPDLAGVTQFVARCRNADGGYGARPGEPSTAAATYQAGIVLYWVEAMSR